MKRLRRDHLFKNHADPVLPIEPPLRVSLGETFEMETIDANHRGVFGPADASKPPGPMAGNPWTGPVYVDGVKAGDVLAITIEDLRIDGHCLLEIGETALLPAEKVAPRQDFIEIRDGVAFFPGGIQVATRPVLGCFGVVPARFVADPWDHGGNLDIPEIRSGSTVHVRCQRDGGYFACGDGHARQGEGEINGFSLEISLTARLTIRQSPYQHLTGILIERDDSISAVGIAHEVPHAIRQATATMTDWLVATQPQLNIGDAYQLASHLGDVRLGAVWPMWCTRWHIPVPVYLRLDRSLAGIGATDV